MKKSYPKIIIFFTITVGTLITIFLVTNSSNFFSKASGGNYPKNIQISNLTDDSATISYQTDGRVLGTIIFGTDPNNLDSLSLDDRDQLNQTPQEYQTHSITLRGLVANTTYYFLINSGDKKYINNGDKFTFVTGSVINGNPPSQIPAVGDVNFNNSTSPSEGIVYVTINGTQKLSALVKNGRYILPLNSLRNSELNQYFKISPNDQIKIEVFAKNQGASVITTPQGLSPITTINLSENYSSTASEYTPSIENPTNSLSPTPSPEKTPSFLSKFKIFNFK